MSNEEIKFDCPACGEGLAIDRRAIGHQVACPFCKDSIMVPEIEEPAAIELEPLGVKQRVKADAGAASLEELANSRPESPKLPPKSVAADAPMDPRRGSDHGLSHPETPQLRVPYHRSASLGRSRRRLPRSLLPDG